MAVHDGPSTQSAIAQDNGATSSSSPIQGLTADSIRKVVQAEFRETMST